MRETRFNPKTPVGGPFAFNPSSGSSSSSLRPPSQLHFVNGTFIAVNGDGSKRLDLTSKVISSLNSGEHQEPFDSSSSMSKDVTKTSPGSELHLESNLIGLKKNINNNIDNEDHNSGGNIGSVNSNNTNSPSSFYTNTLSIVISVGIAFLILNIILLIREFHKKDRRRSRGRDKNHRHRHSSSSQHESSPSTNQVMSEFFFIIRQE